MYFKFEGINTALQGLSRELLTKGKPRQTRGFNCFEYPSPVFIEITNPSNRYCTIKERKWNPILPHVEALWLASGRNDMDLVGHYVKKMYDYSDDGHYMRAGYGPRLRYYNGDKEPYKIGYDKFWGIPDACKSVDQYDFVLQTFAKDPNTRQALISIHDPVKDNYSSLAKKELLVSKDQPCTRHLHFQIVDDKLDLTVYLRSNDLIFGASAVNFFNFTFIQEYFSYMLGIPAGRYFHFANNLHYYDWSAEMIENIANAPDYKEYEFQYKRPQQFDLETFDQRISYFEELEYNLRVRKEFSHDPDLGCDLFNDWKNVIIKKNGFPVKFVNPLLEEII